jgi:hypothetical protein
MSRTDIVPPTASRAVPLYADDISQFCKALRAQLAHVKETPSHLTLLNLLARSAGHRSYQALKASAANRAASLAGPDVPQPIVPPRGTEIPKVTQRALSHFDTAGRLTRWPTQYAVQQLALWGLWMRLPASRDLTEADVTRYFAAFNTFDDPVTLRRELVNAKLLWRTQDGRVYRREAKQASPDAHEFMRLLQAAVKSSPAPALARRGRKPD